MKTTKRALAVVAAVAMLATACGDTPDEGATETEAPTSTATATETETTAPPTGTETSAAGDFKACMVTDTGGVDDRSFNQTSWQGLEQAEDELGVEVAVLESTSAADFEPNINAFLEQDCDLIVTVGFLLGDATLAAAEANPDQMFAIVDYAYEDRHDNILELTFATDEAAFLAGYVAAAMTETGVVGAYGGMNIPTVTIFMDGYLAGVNYYNEANGTDVSVLGWDGSTGQFTEDFEDQTKGRNITENLLQNDADIIMPVAGPVGQGTGAALQAAGQGMMIWVDTDGYVSLPQFQDIILTSVMKNMDVAVFDAVKAVVDGTFAGGLYTGTLENEGVDIAPFHNFEDQVPEEVKTAVDDLRQQIIAGEMDVSL